MLSPSEIQRVEVLVGMEIPTILAPAAGAAGAAVAAGAAGASVAGAVGAQALMKTDNTSSIETKNSKLFFISSFPFRTWCEGVSDSPAELQAGNCCRKVDTVNLKQ